MTSRTEISPVGETIEIVPDDEWLAITGATRKALNMWNGGTKRFMIAALWEHGAFTNESGRSAWELTNWVRENYGIDVPQINSNMMRDEINAPAFTRDSNGKRTFRIALVALPETWYAKLQETLRDEIAPHWVKRESEPEPPVEPQGGIVEPVATVEPDEPELVMEGNGFIDRLLEPGPPLYELEPAPALDLEIASSVAMSLLTTVVEIISAGSPEMTDQRYRHLASEMESVQVNYAKRLDENQAMRRQLREAGDAITALRQERDGLFKRLKASEANLTAALKGDAAKAVKAEVQKHIDAFMRTTPSHKDDAA